MDLLVLENPTGPERIIRIHISKLKTSGLMDMLDNTTFFSTTTIILALPTSSNFGQTDTLVRVRSREELSLYCTETL
jgi:hypothetical protein